MAHDDFWRRLAGAPQRRVRVRNGFALLDERRMFRLMGENGTASIGAVIAHHQAPLARVLRDLREAERQAKGAGGRDAFCITIDKRAGGTTQLLGNWRLEAGWDGDMTMLLDLRDLIARQVSRRAAYLLAESLRDLPATEDALAAALAYRFRRQARVEGLKPVELAQRLAHAAIGRPGKKEEPEWAGPNRWRRDLAITAEFLARERRVDSGTEDDGCIP